MSCQDPQCYNFNNKRMIYCDECIKKEMEKMSYDELVEMYVEGKEWIDSIKCSDGGESATQEMVDKFRKGWFALLNIVLLSRIEN